MRKILTVLPQEIVLLIDANAFRGTLIFSGVVIFFICYSKFCIATDIKNDFNQTILKITFVI